MARRTRSKMNLLSEVERLDEDEIEDDGFIEGDVNFGTPIAVFNFGAAVQAKSDSKDTLVHNVPGKTACSAITHYYSCIIQEEK